MLVPFVRTVILYLAIILAVRLMGKRQVGEMQPAELVITILVSAVASVPMQDMEIPLAHGIVPVLTLIAAEVLISAASLKCVPLRRLLTGRPVPVIREGAVDQSALKQLRLSLDDLFEDLRLNGVFDLRQVAFAQVETNGQLSLMLRTDQSPATPKQLGLRTDQQGLLRVLISDGRLDAKALAQLGQGADWLASVLKANGVGRPEEVFLFCADDRGNTIFFRKEDSPCSGG